jgi:hypothetical protein
LSDAAGRADDGVMLGGDVAVRPDAMAVDDRAVGNQSGRPSRLLEESSPTRYAGRLGLQAFF